ADRTGWSRKEAGRAIRRGRVTVHGEPVADPRAKVDPQAPLELDGESLAAPPGLAVYHKPRGVQCTVGDPMGRRNLESEVADLLTWGLHPVGRLDADTSGLLLMSRHGAITQHLLHPKRAIPRTYRARVEPTPVPELIGVLHTGVATAAGVFAAEDVALDGDVVTLTVREGKHRMVRRMLANAGHPVVDLERRSFGPFTLGELPSGTWRELQDDEREWLGGRGLPI
ncbi:MAG: pseudouridine synthase, partial [Myxococcota bacterium]